MKKYYSIVILIILSSKASASGNINSFFEETLSRGSRGDNVLYLQQVLSTFFGDKVKLDGIFGKQTEFYLKKYQESQGQKPTGKFDKNSDDNLDKFYENNLKQFNKQNQQEKNKSEENLLGGSKFGDNIGTPRGTNFCVSRNGGPDGSGVSSCGTDTLSCKDLATTLDSDTKKDETTINGCKKCPDCSFVKGSCGTALYFYKGSKNNAQRDINREIKAVALTKNKLIETFGSNKRTDYCGKELIILDKNGKPKKFKILDTGHEKSNTVDATWKVLEELGFDDGENPENLVVYRIDDNNPKKTKTASLSK